MPWRAYATSTDTDAQARARHLKIIKPVRNPEPPIAGLGEKASAPYLTVVMPQ